jgi:hypothetical protein
MQYLNWLIRLVLALRSWIFVFMLKSKKQLDFISIVGAENNSFQRIFEMNQNTTRNKSLVTTEYHAPYRTLYVKVNFQQLLQRLILLWLVVGGPFQDKLSRPQFIISPFLCDTQNICSYSSSSPGGLKTFMYTCCMVLNKSQWQKLITQAESIVFRPALTVKKNTHTHISCHLH